jgi:hypothetical protein
LRHVFIQLDAEILFFLKKYYKNMKKWVFIGEETLLKRKAFFNWMKNPKFFIFIKFKKKKINKYKIGFIDLIFL